MILTINLASYRALRIPPDVFHATALIPLFDKNSNRLQKKLKNSLFDQLELNFN
ncbi:MAG: hypothetical protein JWP94_3707 [Mucilaginibacter sp.]|jgi:hypothetical protein|nr:hypothetical protein [Mucilaginibacter sp.]